MYMYIVGNHMYMYIVGKQAAVGIQAVYMSSKSHASKQMLRIVMACLAARWLAHEMSGSSVFLPQPTNEEVESQPEKTCMQSRKSTTHRVTIHCSLTNYNIKAPCT